MPKFLKTVRNQRQNINAKSPGQKQALHEKKDQKVRKQMEMEFKSEQARNIRVGMVWADSQTIVCFGLFIIAWWWLLHNSLNIPKNTEQYILKG